LELLPWSKWRLPAPRRITLPVPVILKRLLTDFLVLIPLGRRMQIPFLAGIPGFFVVLMEPTNQVLH
jgi:hypothetical protein